MKQGLFGRCSASQSTSVTNYAPMTPTVVSATAANMEQIISLAGILSNFRLDISAAPGVGATWTFTLQQNNVDTAVVITITGNVATSGVDITNKITVVPGDLLKWKSVPTSSPSGSYIGFCCDFNGLGCIIPTGGMTFTTVTPVYLGCLSPNDDSTTAAANRTCVSPLAGAITGYRVYRAGTAAASGSFDFSIYKNGVKQDGSGGTVDTRASLSGTGATNTVTATFSLPVAAGDLLYVQSDKNGSPNSSSISFCLTFVPTDNTQFPVCGITPALSTTTGNQFTQVVDWESGTLSASDNQNITLVSPIELNKVYINLSAAPSAGHSRTYAVRKGAADTTLTGSIADAATTGNDTHKVKYAAGDTISFRTAAAGSGTTAAILSYGIAATLQGGQNAGGGNSNNGKKGGGGGLNIINPGGASFVQIGNAGLDVGITS